MPPRSPVPGYRRATAAELRRAKRSPKSRAYVGPNNRIISRRQYENLRFLGDTPFVSWSEYQRLAKNPIYKYDLRLALRANPEVSRKAMRSVDSEFNRLWMETRPLFKDRKSAEYRDPNGPVAQFLAYLGLRNETDDHEVGSSNAEGTPPAFPA